MDRTKAEGIEEFEGTVTEVTVEPSSREDISGDQYHIQIKPEDEELLKDSKTGRMHEWIKIPPKATETSAPEGSILDKYVQELETLDSSLKDTKEHLKIMTSLVDKKFLFKKKKLGKAFGGHEAHEYWTPVQSK